MKRYYEDPEMQIRRYELSSDAITTSDVASGGTGSEGTDEGVDIGGAGDTYNPFG